MGRKQRACGYTGGLHLRPGQSALHRMASSAYSRATTRVRFTTAAFEALYAPMWVYKGSFVNDCFSIVGETLILIEQRTLGPFP